MGNKAANILNSLLTLLCLISLFGGLVYFFYALNFIGVVVSLCLAAISFVIIQYFYLISNKKIKAYGCGKRLNYQFSFANFLILAAYCLPVASCFYVLFKSQTSAAIISPWQAVPGYFFAIYGLASLALLLNIIFNKKLALGLVMVHYFLSFSVAAIVYRLGYGFDPFIHQATENLIDKTGLVEPKTFYYLGQYGLITILHKITAVSIAVLDRWLVPSLAAVFLPWTLWRVLRVWFDSEKLNAFLLLFCLCLPYSFLIVTTPQNLAYLFLILVVLLGLVCKNYYDLTIILVLAAAAAVSQPIAGIPAVLFAGYLAAFHSDRPAWKKYYYLLLSLVTTLILPALFYIVNKNLAPAAPTEITAANSVLPNLSLPGQENFILNFLYLITFNYWLIIILLAIGGLIIACRFFRQCRILTVYLMVFLSLMLAYFLTLKMPFAFLIDYERSDYANRILLVACLFLLPFIILAVYALLKKADEQNKIVKSSLAVFGLICLTAALYLSYPRFDNYFNSHGYSVSASDLKAVDLIEKKSGGDYLVLANQQVSAAALKQYGFKKYYLSTGGQQIFYYPIPTGSPLYQYYLDMVYKKPSRETMMAAMDLAGVGESYFVLNKYWWNFSKILDQAKVEADGWQAVDSGQIFVFKYLR